MKVYDPGILPASNLFFSSCTPSTREVFYHLLCTGHYYCDERYRVDRNSYDSFLILYVLQGKGCVKCRKKKHDLNKGDFAILDCYNPHQYYTETGWEILWIHFDGPVMRQLYDSIFHEKSPVISMKEGYTARRGLEKMYQLFARGQKQNPAVISKEITVVLTELILSVQNDVALTRSAEVIEDTIAYIAENMDQPLPLKELAARVNYSPYHFSRFFKKETGYTPHEFVVLTRINSAKFFLKTGNLLMKEIAYHCGFSSECNFCTTFKKHTGQTPGEYRKHLG